MPNTTDNFDIPFLDGTELVRDYPQFSEDLADAIDGNLLIGSTVATNTALGDGAFTSNTTGSSNTAVGSGALRDNTEGDFNTAVGSEALRDNTTGGLNTAFGFAALRLNTGNGLNTAFGFAALVNNTTGVQNTGHGTRVFLDNTTGNDNTAVGHRAGDVQTTGNNNTSIGHLSDPSSATASNQVTLGNNAITSLRCNVTTISSLSDVRDKTDIVDTQHGLYTLNKIRPVDFTWARRDGTFGSAPDIGFIAQELATVEDETGDAQRLRLTLRDNPEKLEATPGRLIPILVKAVQELSAKNDELEARIEALEAK